MIIKNENVSKYLIFYFKNQIISKDIKDLKVFKDIYVISRVIFGTVYISERQNAVVLQFNKSNFLLL